MAPTLALNRMAWRVRALLPEFGRALVIGGRGPILAHMTMFAHSIHGFPLLG